ncbi:PilZ domain-containing protein [Neobacillus soli]|uniref:PilZ domain-containing protein n=1 Tax=Neobacillus soli TaxID=220688 RepID=UPI000826A069|nr:PilZ domain-containing protein [Neobacillus soli]
MTLKWLNLKPAKKEMTTHENQTSYQIMIKYPFESELTLINPQQMEVETENAVIFIENIGPGGFRFLSNLPLVNEQKIIFTLEADIIENKIHLPGVIIWNAELSEGLYQYGVHFELPENTSTFVHNLLNDYSEKYFT